MQSEMISVIKLKQNIRRTAINFFVSQERYKSMIPHVFRFFLNREMNDGCTHIDICKDGSIPTMWLCIVV